MIIAAHARRRRLIAIFAGALIIFPNIHWAARTFLAAVAARQHLTLASVSVADLTVTCDGVIYQDPATWLAALLPGQALHILPINANVEGAATVVVVIVSASYGAGAESAAFHMEWRFTVRDERIATVHIGPATPLQIPAVVLAYVHAANNFDLDALLSTFADDGLVNDQLRDYWGKDAIAEWAARDLIGDRVTMAIVKIVEHYGQVIITAHVDGNYDKRGLPEPLVLAFYFCARGDKIVQLIILRNIAHL